jgi:arsenite methyltransferase
MDDQLEMHDNGQVQENVKEYYGQTLAGSEDLQTNACCTDTHMPTYLKQILGRLHDEVLMRYYGCGLIVPELIEGLRILDLGCGAGRDVYALAGLVGERGFVTGVDMTPEQLDVARSHQDYHATVFGYEKPNTEFLQGYIENLGDLALASESYDLIVSNCVINLCPDKESVLREAYRLLKPGGEIYFSDVYSDRRIPAALTADPVLHGECLSGALYWNDFLTLAKRAGFADPRLVEDRPITIDNPAIQAKLSGIGFYSATYRLFKLAGLEPDCEDYGQAVIYKGTVPHHPQVMQLDQHHRIERGRVFPVCGNTWRMLADTRFAEHFDFIGDDLQHYGIFAGCGVQMPFTDVAGNSLDAANGSCC